MDRQIIYTGDEFMLIARTFAAGEKNQGTTPRNGFLLSVPTGESDKEAFFNRYPTVCPSVMNESTVFIHYQAQMLQYGKFVFVDETNNWESEEVFENSVGTAFHASYADYAHSYMKFLENSKFTCIIPRDNTVFWERKFHILQPGEQVSIPVRPGMKHRLVVVSGSVYDADTAIHGPDVITIDHNITINTIYQRAQIVELWKAE